MATPEYYHNNITLSGEDSILRKATTEALFCKFEVMGGHEGKPSHIVTAGIASRGVHDHIDRGGTREKAIVVGVGCCYDVVCIAIIVLYMPPAGDVEKRYKQYKMMTR